jgi:hypothetical protein
VRLVGFPSIRLVIHPAGLIGSGFLSQTDSGYRKGVGDLPCAATRSGFREPMGTYLAHHWLVSETVVVDKKNTSVGWVFDFFCNTHML